MAYLLGIDVGTSGTKALLIDEKGNAMASATEEYPLYTPRAQWAEQQPEDWWRATCVAIRAVLTQADIRGSDVSALGLSGQMHGSVFLDGRNEVVRPAILWCDQRTGPQCEWINETAGRDLVESETLNPMLTGFTAPKILWLRQNEPDNYARVRKVLLPKDYIRLMLSGEFATEVSDASGTALLNVRERRWSDKLMNAIDIDTAWMAPVFESYEPSTKVSAVGAAATGLAVGTPIAGGGGDQAAGAVGNGIVRTGVVSSTTGTSGVVFAFMDEPLVDPKLRSHTFCHAVPGKWHVMGVMLSAGGSLRWMRDALCGPERDVAALLGKDPYVVMCDEAADAPLGCEGLVFLPYLTGERTPYPDPDAKGVFFGLHLRHTRAHLIRSVLEGVAFGLKDSFDIFEQMGVPIEQVRASGGGARSPLWRQIQADVTGYAHCTINVEEGPALGVALLGGVAAGIYSSVEEACDAVICIATDTPANPENAKLYARYHQLYQRLYAHLKDDFKVASALT